jgi:hypothetical protein
MPMQANLEGLHTVPGEHRVAAFGTPGTKDGEGKEVGVTPRHAVGVGEGREE